MRTNCWKWGVVLLLGLALTGCAVETQGMGETMNVTSQTVLSEKKTETTDKPPELTLPFSQGTVLANQGTYCWNYDSGNGKWAAVCCDCIHPLQSEHLLQAPITDTPQIKLSFAVMPDTVSVRCWPDTAFGNTNAKSKKCDVADFVLTLTPGGYIYEVTAQWEQTGQNSYGEACYVFYAILEEKHDHTPANEPQTVADPVTGYCGNTMTTLYIGKESYTFMGGNSVTLTDILINLDYCEGKTCRCMAEYKVDTEFGTGYEINLTQGFARCGKGQAALTEEQIETIARIILEEGKRE